MAHSPQRPFVPHPTPTKPRRKVRIPEFRLSKPFVAGASRAPAGIPTEIPAVEPVTSREESLPRIEEFLQTEAAPLQPISAYMEESFSSELAEPDELPPVEHFLDPLPPVEHFTNDEYPGSYTSGVTSNSNPGTQSPTDESDWLETDWQNYDWRAAAALGETTGTDASNAWAETDWDAGAPRRNTPPTPAQAIATALDQIAQRIRDGELVVPSPTTMTDPAALAATVAALLGIRK